MSKKAFWIILLVITIVVTGIGLGLSAYNYYVFDRPFFNSTTKGLLSAFVMSVLMIIIGILKRKLIFIIKMEDIYVKFTNY